MTMFKIKNREGVVIAAKETETLRSAVSTLIQEAVSLHGANLNGASLCRADLREADLREANLNRANLHGADLREANLSGADLRWASLDGANLNRANLHGADLHGANLSGANLSGANLNRANLRVADLRETNLSGANLNGANLNGADLRVADLNGADLRETNLSGTGYYAVPQLHNKILQAIESGGTLDMASWHACETTHCRAGWAIVLAGNAGKLLESQVGSAVAGALIHQASCPWLKRVPDFCAANEIALEDIKQCAEHEKKIQS